MSLKTLISDDYRTQQAALHDGGNYGVAAQFVGEAVLRFMERVRATSLLDYGCGSKRSLLRGLQLPPDAVYEGYDPCVPEFSSAPCPAELVVCLDVLEHVEPMYLDNVLDHLSELCDPYGLFTIHTGPAQKTLPDGRNAHLTQQDKPWWKARLTERFQILEVGSTWGGFYVFVRNKPM